MEVVRYPLFWTPLLSEDLSQADLLEWARSEDLLRDRFEETFNNEGIILLEGIEELFVLSTFNWEGETRLHLIYSFVLSFLTVDFIFLSTLGSTLFSCTRWDERIFFVLLGFFGIFC